MTEPPLTVEWVLARIRCPSNCCLYPATTSRSTSSRGVYGVFRSSSYWRWRGLHPGLAEMDRTSSTIGRSLQAYLDTLDFSPCLKEVETPTLFPVGEESPTSTLEQQRFMAEQLPDSRLLVYPGLGHGINAIYPEWCTQQVREFLATRTN